MPYTLAKFLLWGLLMAFAGGVVGWLLRSLTARVQIAAARNRTIDSDDVERLRGRLANLEPVVAERDRLRMELADVRGSTAGALGFASPTDDPIVPRNDPLDAPIDPAVDDPLSPAAAAVGAAEQTAAAAAAGDDPTEHRAEAPAAGADANGDPVTSEEAAADPGPALDLDAAREVIGRRIRLDDLTVVEGIGAQIAELCHAMGITTWRGLADTDVATLQSMLDDAGSRFRMHRPGTWPRQAELLATGSWDEFKRLTDELSGGA